MGAPNILFPVLDPTPSISLLLTFYLMIQEKMRYKFELKKNPAFSFYISSSSYTPSAGLS